jgi:hypothetical protein
MSKRTTASTPARVPFQSAAPESLTPQLPSAAALPGRVANWGPDRTPIAVSPLWRISKKQWSGIDK